MSMIDKATGRPLRVADLQQELEMITRLARMWSDNAGERLTEVRIIGDRVVGYGSELAILRLANAWSTCARNRYPEVRDAGVLGWSYSMDHLLRMEPVPERMAA